MSHAYYRIWAGKVISFCWLAVVAQQGIGVVWRPDWSAGLLLEPRVAAGVRRPLSAAEAAQYQAERARVQRYVRVGLWAGLLIWAVATLACAGRAGEGTWAVAAP